MTADVLSETMQVRRLWRQILKYSKKKEIPFRILNRGKISPKDGGEIKTFSDIPKVKEFTKSRTPPYKTFNRLSAGRKLILKYESTQRNEEHKKWWRDRKGDFFIIFKNMP